ncbi:MAG: peptidase M22 [Clostridia bacterium]|nr:peptidase M22 [Clostridia bacterium]
MGLFLGIDTSNYTTSVALYDSETKNVISKKMLLPVKDGEKGIRQSDAVFHHTQQIRELLPELLGEANGNIKAVTVSTKPRFVEGSYMPCFTVGQTVATSVASALGVPLFEVSHQEGHVTAALFSAGRLDLVGENFLAFHVSGGTTESLRISKSDRCPVTAETLGTSSDLKAGQAVDRVGVMLGLKFPCGPELEKLALKSTFYAPKIKVSMKGADCSLSGLENKCKKMFDEGQSKEDISLFCLKYIESALKEMLDSILAAKPLPIVFSGGVMSNSILQNGLSEYCDSIGREAFFAEPQYSSDNAVGVAILGSYLIEV